MTKPPVKVMRIIARLNVGGPALHCLLLADRMRRYGYETTLVAGRMAQGEADYTELFDARPELADLDIRRLGALQRAPGPLADLKTLWQLVALMRRERPRIVHTHTAKAGVLGRLAALIAGVPTIVHTFHGHVLRGYFSAPVSALVTSAERALARASSAIVTLSPALQTELCEEFRVAPRGRFHIVPLGRDLEAFQANAALRGELRAELGITDPRTQLIGSVGRLVPIKDHETLLRAFAALVAAPDAPPRRLLIVGEGELGEALRARVAELGLSGQVDFLGWRADLPRILADLDVLANSSRNEGTPLSIIEAFAGGCPVVATRVGGVADMFSEEDGEGRCAEGGLVPAGQPEALAAALGELLGDAGRRERCAERARAAGTRYDAENLAANMARLYDGLLPGPG